MNNPKSTKYAVTPTAILQRVQTTGKYVPGMVRALKTMLEQPMFRGHPKKIQALVNRAQKLIGVKKMRLQKPANLGIESGFAGLTTNRRLLVQPLANLKRLSGFSTAEIKSVQPPSARMANNLTPRRIILHEIAHQHPLARKQAAKVTKPIRRELMNALRESDWPKAQMLGALAAEKHRGGYRSIRKHLEKQAKKAGITKQMRKLGYTLKEPKYIEEITPMNRHIERYTIPATYTPKQAKQVIRWIKKRTVKSPISIKRRFTPPLIALGVGGGLGAERIKRRREQKNYAALPLHSFLSFVKRHPKGVASAVSVGAAATTLQRLWKKYQQERRAQHFALSRPGPYKQGLREAWDEGSISRLLAGKGTYGVRAKRALGRATVRAPEKILSLGGKSLNVGLGFGLAWALAELIRKATKQWPYAPVVRSDVEGITPYEQAFYYTRLICKQGPTPLVYAAEGVIAQKLQVIRSKVQRTLTAFLLGMVSAELLGRGVGRKKTTQDQQVDLSRRRPMQRYMKVHRFKPKLQSPAYWTGTHAAKTTRGASAREVAKMRADGLQLDDLLNWRGTQSAKKDILRGKKRVRRTAAVALPAAALGGGAIALEQEKYAAGALAAGLTKTLGKVFTKVKLPKTIFKGRPTGMKPIGLRPLNAPKIKPIPSSKAFGKRTRGKQASWWQKSRTGRILSVGGGTPALMGGMILAPSLLPQPTPKPQRVVHEYPNY